MNDKNYDDILYLEHHVSLKRPHMSMSDRAAQFAPFAALTGHEAAINETARQTDKEIELSDDQKAMLNSQIKLLASKNMPDVTVTYFVPDKIKTGGTYRIASGKIEKIDFEKRFLQITNGQKIDLMQICRIESDIFDKN